MRTVPSRTQGALPTEDSAVVLPFSLVAGRHIKVREVDGWRKISAVIRQRMRPAA
jgi:hypothetical protein